MKLTQSPRSPLDISREPSHTVIRFHSDEVGPVTIRLDPLCLPARSSGVYFGSSPLRIEPTTTFLGETPKGSPYRGPDDAPLHSHYEPFQLTDGPAPIRIPHKPNDPARLAVLKDEYNTGRIEFAEYLERSRQVPVHLMPEDDSQPHKFISLFILLLIVSASIIGVWLL